MLSFDRFISHPRQDRALEEAISYLGTRRTDYDALLLASPTKVIAGVVLMPTIRMALLDQGPGQRVTLAIMGKRIELIVDERYGPGRHEYTTEVYVVSDMRQIFAWFLAQYW